MDMLYPYSLMHAPKHVHIQYADVRPCHFNYVKKKRWSEHHSSSKACDIISFAGAHGGREPWIQTLKLNPGELTLMNRKGILVGDF